MRTVWKFLIVGALDANIEMPTGAKVIHVARQDPDTDCGFVTVWAEVDPEAPSEIRHFTVIGTGHPVPDGYEHVGTWFHGEYVWHLYEVAS